MLAGEKTKTRAQLGESLARQEATNSEPPRGQLNLNPRASQERELCESSELCSRSSRYFGASVDSGFLILDGRRGENFSWLSAKPHTHSEQTGQTDRQTIAAFSSGAKLRYTEASTHIDQFGISGRAAKSLHFAITASSKSRAVVLLLTFPGSLDCALTNREQR